MYGAVADPNRTPEQEARDTIDEMLEAAGWKVQPYKGIECEPG